MHLLKNITCYQLNEYVLSGPKRNIEFCFPETQSVINWSVLLYLPTQKWKKKLRQKYSFDAAWHNFAAVLKCMITRKSKVRVVVSLEELVSFFSPLGVTDFFSNR